MPELVQLPAIANAPLSVVLLAQHADAPVAEVVASWVARLDKLDREYEILLVFARHIDPEGTLAATLSAAHPPIRILCHPSRRGVGAALSAGIAAAQHPLLFYTECDRQYHGADLRQLLGEIDKVHLVSGFRKWQRAPGWVRWLGRIYRGLARVLFGYPLEPLLGWLGWKEHAYRWLVRVLFGVRMSDVNCAFRLCRRDIFARIPVQSDGPFVHVEILAKANFLGFYMNDEVPVPYRPRIAGDTAAGEPSRLLADAYRVFSEADFGPPVLPEQSATG